MTRVSRGLARLRHPVHWGLDSYFLFRTNLAATQTSVPDERANDELVIEEVHSADTETLTALVELIGRQSGRRPEIEKAAGRLQRYDRCFVAKDNQSVVGMRWLACPGSPIFSDFAALVKKVAASRVFNRAYVVPEYRGRGLQKRLDRAMKQKLWGEGVETTFVFVGVYNLASVHNCLRCNDHVRLIHHVRLDAPFVRPINLYPKLSQEPWKACESVVRGV